MKLTITVDLPDVVSPETIDTYCVTVRNVARVLFPSYETRKENVACSLGSGNSGVTDVAGLHILCPAHGCAGREGEGDVRSTAGDRPAWRLPRSEGVAGAPEGAESGLEWHTGPVTGSLERSEGHMKVGRRRGWGRPWRLLKKVGAGKHFTR